MLTPLSGESTSVPRPGAVATPQGRPAAQGRAGEATGGPSGPSPPASTEGVAPALSGETAYAANRAAAADQDDRRDTERAAEDTSDKPWDLSPEEEARVRELRARDREVRSHERAHQTAGAGVAGAASYETVRGPDGHSYAVSGEVPIRANGGGSPEETIQIMRQVKRAALAPAQPSGQDRAVAQQAEQRIRAAQAELAEQRRAESAAEEDDTPEDGPTDIALVRRASEAYQALQPSGKALSLIA